MPNINKQIYRCYGMQIINEQTHQCYVNAKVVNKFINALQMQKVLINKCVSAKKVEKYV